MADTLEGLRSQIMTSIHGRRLGLDSNGYLVGPPGLRAPVTAYVATTANTGYAITQNYGLVSIFATTAVSLFTMPPLAPGQTMSLVNISTGGPKITLTSGAFQTSTGNDSTFLLWTASSSGQSANLIGLTTALTLVQKLSTGITVG